MIYKDKTSSFEELLQKDRSVSIHTISLKILATQMFKVYKNVSSPIICEVFNRREINYELCTFVQFSVPYVKGLYHGTEKISCLSPKTWEIFPNKNKQLAFLNSFKNAIKKWKPSNCSCKLCDKYVQIVGFF